MDLMQGIVNAQPKTTDQTIFHSHTTQRPSNPSSDEPSPHPSNLANRNALALAHDSLRPNGRQSDSDKLSVSVEHIQLRRMTPIDKGGSPMW